MTETISFIPSRVKNCAEGGHVAGARDIIDDGSGITLDELVGNKEYASADFSGMGRVVFKKNIVNGVNTLTQQMMSDANTIYIIQYDFTLGGDITVPANCVLEFDGGSISGGHSITGNNTGIEAGETLIFSNVAIYGTWLCPCIYSDWFNFVKGSEVDNSQNFKNLSNLLSNAIHNDLFISAGTYWTQADNGFPKTVSGKYRCSVMILKGNTTVYNSGTIKLFKSEEVGYDVFYLESTNLEENNNINIIGGKIVGDLLFHTPATALGKEWGHGIYINGSSDVTIKNVDVSYCLGDGILTTGYYFGDYVDFSPSYYVFSNRVNILNCHSSYNHRQGLSICDHCYNYIVDNCIFEKTGKYIFTAPGAGIDIESHNDTTRIDYITISNCKFIDNQKGLEGFRNVSNVVVENCIDVHTDDYVEHETPDYEYDAYGKTPYGCFLDSFVTDDKTCIALNNFKTDGAFIIRLGKIDISNSELTTLRFNDTTFTGERAYTNVAVNNSTLLSEQGGIPIGLPTQNNNITKFKFYNCKIQTFHTNGYVFQESVSPIVVNFTRCNFYGNGTRIRIPCFADFYNCIFNNIQVCTIDGSNISGKCRIFNSFIYLKERETAATRINILSPSSETSVETVYVQGLSIFQDDETDKKYTFGASDGTRGVFTLVDVYIKGLNSDGTVGLMNLIAQSYPCIKLRLRNGPRFSVGRGNNASLTNLLSIMNRYLDMGQTAYNTELEEFCVYGVKNNNQGWLGYDGAVSGVKRSGTFANRPSGTNIYIGFKYMIVEDSPARHMPIYYGGDSKWYDAAGNEVTT